MTSEEIKAMAIQLALANGHKDPNAEIVCVGGRREPVWRFYRDQAYDQLCRC